MTVTPRQYTGPEDFHHLDDILVAGWQAAGGSHALPVHYVHPGDIRWWMYYTFPGEEPWKNIYLWEEEHGRVVAWTLTIPHEEVVGLFCLPELHGSNEMKSMLAWSVDLAAVQVRATGASKIRKAWVRPDDIDQIHALEALGFQRSGTPGVHMVCSLDGPLPPPRVPSGFRLRGCRGPDELESRAAAQYSAFESELPFDQYLERFRRFMESPAYQPEEDVVVEAQDGQIVAFAKLWPSVDLCCGKFEPLGVHADYQRRGLGRAMMLEGLRRLRSWGMTQAHVGTGSENTPAIRLYEAVGFHFETYIFDYACDV